MSVCFHLVFISDFNLREFVRVSALHFGTILVLPAPVFVFIVMVAFSTHQVVLVWYGPVEILIKVVHISSPLAVRGTEVNTSTAVKLPPSVLALVVVVAAHSCHDVVWWTLIGELLVKIIDVR